MKYHENIVKLANRFIAKLATVDNDTVLHQQWLDALKQEGVAGQNMLQFWMNFLTANNIKSYFIEDYTQNIEVAKKLQTFTAASDRNEIVKVWQHDIGIDQNNILLDCVNAGWYNTKINVWSNSIAENAFYKYIEYAKQRLAKIKQARELFEKT